jgi:hypothetical protein
MTATFRSLCDNDVGTGGNATLRLGHAACHQRNFAAGVVGAIDIPFQILLGPRPGQGNRRRLFTQSGGKAILIEQEHQKIERKRFASQGTDRDRRVVDLRGGELMAALGAKSTRFTDGGDHLGARVATAQAAECDRIFYSQQATDARPNHFTTSSGRPCFKSEWRGVLFGVPPMSRLRSDRGCVVERRTVLVK